MSAPTCKLCGAVIRWIRTRNGRPMPVDPERRSEWVTDVPIVSQVRITLVDPDGDTHTGFRASVLTPDARAIDGYVMHFATCEKARRGGIGPARGREATR